MLAVAMLTFAASSPGQSFLVGQFNTALCDHLGIGPDRLAACYMIATMLAAVPLTLIGRASDRFGPRVVLAMVGTAFVLACFGMRYVSGVVTLTLGFFLLRFLGQGSLSVISGHTVALWFERRLGTVEAVRHQAMSIAIIVLPWPVVWLISEQGWQTAYAALAGFVALCVLLPVALLFRNKPEDIGQRIDNLPHPRFMAEAVDEGMERREHAHDNEPGHITQPQPAFTLKQTLAQPVFWLISLPVAYNGLVGTALIFQMQPLLVSAGLDERAGPKVMAPWPIAGVAAMLVGGWLADRVRPAALLAASPLLLGIATTLFLVGLHEHSIMLLAAGMAVFGVSQSLGNAAAGPTIARYFGRPHHGAIRGFTTSLGVGMTSVGPWLLAVIADVFRGGFPVALAAMAAVCVPLAVGAAFVSAPRSARSPA